MCGTLRKSDGPLAPKPQRFPQPSASPFLNYTMTTAYIPLKEGETITEDCVRFSISDCSINGPTSSLNQQFNSRDHLQYFRAIQIPNPLPVAKEEKDPYADLKRAHAEGKVIQILAEPSLRWRDLPPCKATPNFIYPASEYRPKPEPAAPVETEPEWIPLGPEMFPPGSVFRWGMDKDFNAWTAVVHASTEGIWLPTMAGNDSVRMIKFSEFTHTYPNAEVSRDFGRTWHPCRKQATPAEPEKGGDFSIQGKDPYEYLCEQFPAVEGHIPLKEFLAKCKTAFKAGKESHV